MTRVRLVTLILALAILSLGSNPVSASPDMSGTVSLQFTDTPINTVLSMLAKQQNLNLVVSDQVTGNVSIHITDVALATALDALLTPNGYNYYVHDNVIVVKAAEQVISGERISKTFSLEYIDAETARSAVVPLLSDKGSAIALVPPAPSGAVRREPIGTSRLVIYDYPSVLDMAAALLADLDRKRRQISIEVKMIETNLNKEEQLGINWPKSVAVSLEGTDGSGTGTDNTDGSDAAYMPLESGNWQLGNLTVGQVTAVLDFLEKRGDSRLLSNPRVTTLDNETASIEITTVIPIQTINRLSEGAIIQDVVTFQDEQVGIKLEVTPRINRDGSITMQVDPVVEEIIGYNGPAGNQKPITSERSVSTKVVVEDKETVVLGGLLKENNIKDTDRLFLLGSIPLLGKLFTHTSNKTETTDLIIMITPQILD